MVGELREQSVSQLLIGGAFGLFPTLILGGVVALWSRRWWCAKKGPFFPGPTTSVNADRSVGKALAVALPDGAVFVPGVAAVVVLSLIHISEPTRPY